MTDEPKSSRLRLTTDMAKDKGLIVLAWVNGTPYISGRFDHDATIDDVWRWTTEHSNVVPDKIEIFLDRSPRPIDETGHPHSDKMEQQNV